MQTRLRGYPRRLVCAFLIHSLESIISKLSTSKISKLYILSVVEQTVSSPNGSDTRKKGFLTLSDEKTLGDALILLDDNIQHCGTINTSNGDQLIGLPFGSII